MAVVILGIVVSPLLHSFVTSAKTAQKSRLYGDATTAAQNIIETIEATDTDVLLTNAASIGGGAVFYAHTVNEGVDSYTVSTTAVKDSAGKYYIGLPVSSGNSNFEALVTLDASHAVNNEPVTEYTELIATSQATGADNPDNLAKTEFNEDMASATNSSSPTLSRRITITVGTQTPDAGGVTVRYPISIVYDYTGGFFCGTDGTDYYNFAREYTSETYYTAVLADITAGEPVFSMFYFFDSFYGLGGTTDTVYIYNNQNNSGTGSYDLQFNLFLVRQKTSETETREGTYASSIIQYEPYGLGTDGEGHYLNACKIYTNMNTNLNTGVDIVSFDYRVYRDALWYNPGTAEPKLVVSHKLDRLLYINVRLYPSGSDFSDTSIASMDASKLD